MSENKLCPHCGGKMFMATITRACVVEVTEDETPYKILKEGKDKFDIAILKCARCRQDVKEEDLVAAIKCKECGRLVTPADVDENGVCDVCNAMHQRTELANASKEDLVKMLLEAEKRSNPVAAKMAGKQVTVSITDKTEDGIPTGITLTPVEETEVEETEVEKPAEGSAKKPRTRRRRTEEATVETTEETPAEVVEETPVEESSAVDDLANQQEAPFPDMNLPEEMTDTPQEEQTPAQESAPAAVQEESASTEFQMFDDGEDAF